MAGLLIADINKIKKPIIKIGLLALASAYLLTGCTQQVTDNMAFKNGQPNSEKMFMDLSEDKDSPRVFINPKVTPLVEEKQPYEEGCLSVPDVYDKVERPNKVRIEALDQDGNAIDEEVEGLLAVCIQHEMDHLNGVIFVDYLSNLKQTRARDKVRKVLKIREKQEADKQPQPTTV